MSLRDVRPAIWRRLTVPADLGLLSFHDVLPKAFGWTDSHLRAFIQVRQRFEILG